MMNYWDIWIDTGGTFTDCIGIDPSGKTHKVKVLSNSSLRGKIIDQKSPTDFLIEKDWELPEGFLEGYNFQILGLDHNEAKVTALEDSSLLRIDISIAAHHQLSGATFEVQSAAEAPVLASQILTQTLPGDSLPPMLMRLATTKGTNALLEGKGAPTVLLITKGFKDLLLIGNQKRPDLFAMEVVKPSPIYDKVIEVDERLEATGKTLEPLEFSGLEEVQPYLESPACSFAICLMNSYRNNTHEEELKEWLENKGATHVSISSELSPFIKILPRTQTALVNAYLDPLLQDYFDSVKKYIDEGALHVMTSAGGLTDVSNFHPKDSLLSGPAGGVVGASAVGKEAGFNKLISFDMGGTSTDVARIDDGFDYTFEHAVGEATLNAPALSIETVAAGGGSICSFDGQKLTVGPESAGAFPGPACYNAGGPLTITDVNLLLGRLDPENFGIPVDKRAAEEKLEELLREMKQTLNSPPGKKEILEGFLQIANEKMADTVGKISMRKGYDPSDYALVAFGGAGGQHACAIAGLLDIKNIVIPADAGLLSAYGLGNAVIERFAEKQILKPLPEVSPEIEGMVEQLEEKALQKLKQEITGDKPVEIRRKLIFMRLEGQDSTLEVEYCDNLFEAFKDNYRRRYGHWISNRPVEVESIRVVASTRHQEQEYRANKVSTEPEPLYTKEIQFNLKTKKCNVYDRKELQPGHSLTGPALVLDPYSTLVLEEGWELEVTEKSSLKLDNKGEINKQSIAERSKSVALELITNRFTAIADEMGEILKRTALSVNIKERMDYSCALLNPEGQLVVNAPHIPVHLGALGMCVREVRKALTANPGDVFITNHPAFGGSHLPDVTVITPVFTEENTLLGYAASRAHHAEIGGTRPGSMPPDATSLTEEGVVIPPMYLIKGGNEQWEQIRAHLSNCPYPPRNIDENIADLQAAVAANNQGVTSLKELAEIEGAETIHQFMVDISEKAGLKTRQMLQKIPDGTYHSGEKLDDGSILNVHIVKKEDTITFDFSGTSEQHPGNLNATPAIVSSVIMYVIRLLIDEPLPLNEGLLDPVTVKLPKSLLNPSFTEEPKGNPAVVGGNTEVSQRLVDLLLKPFEKVACSQGTMNNVLFGNENFGYYETIGGGTGAGSSFHGTDAVHNHMTNTGGTDPEILEHRYPVRLNRYEIRKNSGGSGKYKGGDGIEKEITFLEPVSLSVLTQHRKIKPYGLQGGRPGSNGKQWVVRTTGNTESLGSVDGKDLKPGDRFIIQTPGGGGFGKV